MASTPAAKLNDEYILARHTAANLRINMQHYLWQEGGYVIHPGIPTNVENLRVADIGCGTGIWLIHASQALPASAQLDGFDINLDAAPPQEWMPKNVKLHARDMMAPIADDLVGKYDIVNLRFLISLLWGKEVEPVVQNFLKLLSKKARTRGYRCDIPC